MNVLDLFAGVGGGILATKHILGWRTVCYVENAPYPTEVLKARIRDGLLDDAPIWDDARTFDGRPWRGCVDLITAGFPCQPWSGAGQQLGELDPRNLWPDTIRIINQISPQWCILENVPTITTYVYFQQILSDLAAFVSHNGGGWIRGLCLSAAALGANHIRQRLWLIVRTHPLWLLAHPHHRRLPEPHHQPTSQVPLLSRTHFIRGRNPITHQIHPWWATEPRLDRLAYGVARRLERGRAIGNGQVPTVAATICNLLIQSEHSENQCSQLT